MADDVPNGGTPTLEQHVDDTRNVLDEVHSRRAVIFGPGFGGPIAILFAATYPERTQALILHNSFARYLRDSDYPWGLPVEFVPRLIQNYDRIFGTGTVVDFLAPSRAADEEFRSWYARYERLCALAWTRTHNRHDLAGQRGAYQCVRLGLVAWPGSSRASYVRARH